MPTPVNLRNATLRITAGEIRQFPSDPMPQIALCGRSNVGKSSLINSLLNQDLKVILKGIIKSSL